ncbi:hypothetical protein C7H19_19220 [Aphanothece hegewaldii CCALA 016]|uniref:Glycosyl hydrolase-like 10 domain-containing protein n=1 Tax=Aphanothece hegewaldii CCALA 016 TaxID=2107694 RepID=A0A2T1LTS5_9CHRO|nr:family 10 glycosylhydrolase [Aphanothece hegewaldii]PSF34262.1 hypothetical protein C7H19_19220 [Aphanothece hegewaldii CCALA 016]
MQEIRGVWIPNIPHSRVLMSPENIAQSMNFLQKCGFNVVFPVMWNQGYTLYPSERMQQEGFRKTFPYFKTNKFDPLEILIKEAHSRNIAVIPWFEYGFAASPIVDGGYLIEKNPHWLALDQGKNPVIKGGLTWMNSLHPEVQQFMLDLILEVVQNYPVDGIQGDDRFPAMPIGGGYDETTLQIYQQEYGNRAKPPLNVKDQQWMQWRANQLTLFLRRLYFQVKAINPNLIVSMAPAVYPFCYHHLLQDSPTWLNLGIVDLLHPQFYRENFQRYEIEVNKINLSLDTIQKAKISPGIAFRANGVNLTPNDILKCVELNRKKGLQGQVFFHYEGLLAHNKANARALKTKGVYDRMASLPTFCRTTNDT